MELKDYPTCELVKELKKREGVEWIYSPNPLKYSEVSVKVTASPASVLVVYDRL